VLTYKKSGVDIDAANKLVGFIKRRTPGIGGFAGLYPLGADGRRDSRLVASTDGVGTKLKLAFDLDSHASIGIDLVAMCVNDLLTCGARPLFFLDYFATGKLDLRRAKKVVSGIIEGCRRAGTALLGGETAEMPGFYKPGEYDLAGFAVGIVRKKEVIDGSAIRPGDSILALPSSGVHSNGFSMVRKAFSRRELRRRARSLLAPTLIYAADVARIREALSRGRSGLLGMAHITGGGIPENLPRVLPEGCAAVLETASWKPPRVFRDIQEAGNVPLPEMRRTFNMGLGMLLVLRPQDAPRALKAHPGLKTVGRVIAGRRTVDFHRA